MSFFYKTISDNLDSINSGSLYEQSELDNVVSSSISDITFGLSDQDVIEFSIYDIEGNLKSWNYINQTPIYNIINKKYKDVDQNTLEYNYKKYDGGYKISFNRQILLDTLQDFSNNKVTENSVVSYNFLRNIAGNSKFPLIIKSISPSRKELQLIPSFKNNLNDEELSLINLEILSYSQKKILLRDIVSLLIEKLEAYQIYSISDKLISENKNIFSIIRTVFGFSKDLDVINFFNETYVGYTKVIQGNDNQIIYDVFDGILGYLKNWLYTYYKEIKSVSELQKDFEYIIKSAININLNKINVFYGSNIKNKDLIINFIMKIFYDDFIKNEISNVCSLFNSKFLSYLQNALNFGNNNFVPILNHDGYVDENGITNIIIKLHDYLPQSYGLRNFCWISNISIPSIINKTILNLEVVKKSFRISGPNFNIKQIKKDSKSIDYKTANDLKLGFDDNKEVNFYKKLTELNVNYEEFSNFIIFSSAELRIKLFLNKLLKINLLQERSLSYISSSVSASNSVSMSYSTEYANVNTQLNSIFDSFDGYDVFLYNKPFISEGVVNNLELDSYIEDAVEYDKSNFDSLINNTPNHIITDENNSDYLVFLSMIGHHFDNLYLYINQFPTLQNTDNIFNPTFNTASLSCGQNSYLASFANVMLESFGWNPISSFDDKSIGETYLSGSNSISGDEKLKILWNRILQNLPLIYKTKGTEECVRLLSNIYGIPSSILNVKEFGGNDLADDTTDSFFISEKKYYFTKYNSLGEYISIPTNENLKSVEFKFKLDSNIDYIQNKDIYLLKCPSANWSVKINKAIKKYSGNICLTLADSNDLCINISDIPIFNGKIYNVFIKTIDTGEDFDVGTGYPSYIYFRVTSVEDDRIVFDSYDKLLLDKSNIDIFTSSSTLYFGNYISDNLFVGNIDKINIWKIELDDKAFLDHCYNFDAYNDYTPSSSYDNLTFRYSLDYPVNLYSSSNVYNYTNANKYYNSTASIFNFKETGTSIVNCVEVSSSIFPYQFNEIDIRQSIKSSYAGPNKYKNTKINKINEAVVSRFMPTERSVKKNITSQDSNLIGVYISPFKVRDDDIYNFIGNYDLMDTIGDPNNLYESKYSALRRLQEYYNKNNLSEKVLYQEFITLYKHYFDGSFFDTIKQLFPIRSKVITGILVEPSLLERDKYQNKRIDSTLPVDLNKTLSEIYSVNSDNFEMRIGNVSSSISRNGDEAISNNNNFKSNYISDYDNEIRNSAFSINGNFVGRDITGSLTNYIITYINKDYVIEGDLGDLSKSFIEYNLYKSGSTIINPFQVDSISYPNNHISMKYNPISRMSCVGLENNSTGSYNFIKSQQTIYTTVNDVGISDGSSPVEVTNINRDVNQISLTVE